MWLFKTLSWSSAEVENSCSPLPGALSHSGSPLTHVSASEMEAYRMGCSWPELGITPVKHLESVSSYSCHTFWVSMIMYIVMLSRKYILLLQHVIGEDSENSRERLSNLSEVTQLVRMELGLGSRLSDFWIWALSHIVPGHVYIYLFIYSSYVNWIMCQALHCFPNKMTLTLKLLVVYWGRRTYKYGNYCIIWELFCLKLYSKNSVLSCPLIIEGFHLSV